MKPTKRLEERIASETESYGFSLTTWGVGALLIDHFGIPALPGVLAYVIGAVAGYATLALIAFGGLFDRTEMTDSPLILASAIHVVATLGTVLAASVVIQAGDGVVSPIVVFGLSGYTMSICYNVLLMIEAVLARIVA